VCCAIQTLQSEGYEVGTIIHDGFLVRSLSVKDGDLRDAEEAMKKVFFIVKDRTNSGKGLLTLLISKAFFDKFGKWEVPEAAQENRRAQRGAQKKGLRPQRQRH
jgi:hypothetical protein